MNLLHININTMVRVKLTKDGIKILQNNHENTNMVRMGNGLKMVPYVLKLDEQGYYEAPLWQIMSTFGNALYESCPNPPFEMDMLLEFN